MQTEMSEIAPFVVITVGNNLLWTLSKYRLVETHSINTRFSYCPEQLHTYTWFRQSKQ